MVKLQSLDMECLQGSTGQPAAEPLLRPHQSLSALDVLAVTPASPENLEALSMLQTGARVHGADAWNCVIWNEARRLVVVQGNPPPDSISFALEHCPQARVILARDGISCGIHSVLRGWHCASAERFIFDSHQFKPRLSGPRAEFFDVITYAHMLPGLGETFRDELLEAHSEGPVAISLDDGCIAAYCFAGWRVQGFFDLCVVTLPAFRRRGHAFSCCSALISTLQAAGQHPQWFTLSTNLPSIELAYQLGFRRLESLLLFKREPYNNQSPNGESHG